ncbi:MAG TPA: LysR family transcriptional regulator [Syntrophorhabdaceae bacterium]|nr:LysR family transcriptional regulator [Syntrophorhabdaceae bacterium]HQJ94477.1 LysR family transcriptional regulator [Syntrophorhabdaceae bacterium]
MILNMNQLRAFYIAARTGSITKAARELMVTPPAITMQVKQLEKTLNIRLLFREGNSVRLTDIGKTVYKKAERVFCEINEMENFFKDISTGKSGELKIGCPQMHAKYFMPSLIGAFKDVYPGIKIVLDQGSNAKMVKSIIDHKNELALIRNVANDKRLKIRVIGKVEVVLVTAQESVFFPSGSISISEVSEVPLIMMSEGSALREVIYDFLKKYDVLPTVSVESASRDFIKELVRQDEGVTFLEKYSTDEFAESSLREVKILEGAPVLEFGIAYLNRRNLSPAAWSFLRLLDKPDDLLPFIK